jgi:hypothetical protein
MTRFIPHRGKREGQDLGVRVRSWPTHAGLEII